MKWVFAVQSHWFSVGTSVSWAEAGVGAVATQSFVNKSFGIRGLNLLRNGLTAQQALDSLLNSDEGREVRQVAIIDSKGNVAAHTGKGCIQYASNITGNNFSASAIGNTVFFGAVRATVTTSSVTLLNVTVPFGAGYQPVTVTVNGLTFNNRPPAVNLQHQ